MDKKETTPSSLPSSISPASMLRQVREIARESRKTLKEAGFRGLLKRYGWKALAVFVIYYLIRDTLLYLVLPYLVARNFF